MSRGNGRMHIFHDDEDYRRFVYLLGDVVEEFDIECWNYCLMPNHYHATLRPTQANLSNAIRRLNSVYGQWWNRRHGRVGHVFQGRFRIRSSIGRLSPDSVSLRRDESRSRTIGGTPRRLAVEQLPGDSRTERGSRVSRGVVDAAFFGDGQDAVLQARYAGSVATPAVDLTLTDRIRSNERIFLVATPSRD
jgi:hypothetical protein